MIRFRPALVPTLIFLPGLALLLGLGVWQVQRLQWKTDLIERVEARTRAAPVPLEAALASGLTEAEWRRVTVHGHFAHQGEMYLVATGPHGESGVDVITPLSSDGGRVVLINRGFVPDARRDPSTRSAGQVAGAVTIAGIVRLSQEPGWFTPEPDRAHRLFFSRTVAPMGAMLRDATVMPVFVEADATPNPGGYPAGRQTAMDIPNDHLSYAVTWFALALTLMAVYLIYHAKQGRLTFGRR